MDPERLAALVSDVVGLLLVPTLGVLGLMDRRSALVLRWTRCGSQAALALATGRTIAWSQGRFLRVWLAGTALGAAFLGVEWLRRKRAGLPGAARVTAPVALRPRRSRA